MSILVDYNRFARLKEFTDSVGEVYGTEDFCMYLYSVVKMSKPETIVELGTGLGTTMLWIAMALDENQKGQIHTVDNGRDWASLANLKPKLRTLYRDDYAEYINNLVTNFNLDKRVVFYNEQISVLNATGIDLLFSDFDHSPYSILNCFANYLGRMKENSCIYIDSASTYYPSFLLLEQLIDELNQGKIGRTLSEMIPLTQKQNFENRVKTSKFRLIHLIENKNRNQNSTACIQIEPRDIFPQPRVNIRF